MTLVVMKGTSVSPSPSFGASRVPLLLLEKKKKEVTHRYMMRKITGDLVSRRVDGPG